jgi:hypothetical protein
VEYVTPRIDKAGAEVTILNMIEEPDAYRPSTLVLLVLLLKPYAGKLWGPAGENYLPGERSRKGRPSALPNRWNQT